MLQLNKQQTIKKLNVQQIIKKHAMCIRKTNHAMDNSETKLARFI